MLLTVPTYRRHSNGEAVTLTNLPRDLPLTLVVRASEADQYQSLLESLGRTADQLWQIPEGDVSGIATTRQWIADRAVREGCDRFFMIDDDLKFAVRGKTGLSQGEKGWDYRLTPSEDVDSVEMFEYLDTLLDDYQHVGVSTRDGNNHNPGFFACSNATRCIRCVGFRLDNFKSGKVRYRPEVEGREDLDLSLQLLRLGYPNLVTFHWAQDQKSADNPGGLEGLRNQKQLYETANKLVELHPAYVKTRTKVNKTGRMAGERTEVTIFWKKALANG